VLFLFERYNRISSWFNSLQSWRNFRVHYYVDLRLRLDFSNFVSNSNMFSPFNRLPYELRAEVWSYAAANFGESRVIECIWEGIPYYQKSRRRGITGQRPERAGLRYKYRLREISPRLDTLSTRSKSREVTLRLVFKNLDVDLYRPGIRE
jgi:hypothetical protein